VGPFSEAQAISLDDLQQMGQDDTADREAGPIHALLPVEAGLAALPALTVSSADAGRLARGQSVLLRGRDAPVIAGPIAVFAQRALIALADADKGELHPRRVFNLTR
jgi:tRNA pseudouridine55 synthase